MEKKQGKQTPSTSKTMPASGQSMWTFFEEVKAEFKKVTWTSREELAVYTKIVVGATFVFGMAIYAVDLLVQTGLMGMGQLIRIIIG